MNTNIVNYIIKNKKLTQSQIAEKLSVSQVAVSKWKRGENIPDEREVELLQIADLYWKITDNEPEIFTIDSKWNILIQSEENQEDWYDLISEIVSPKKILNEHGEYESQYFSSFVRECVLLLNGIEFVFPTSANSVKADGFYFDLFYRWMLRTCQLQTWCINTVPRPHNPKESDPYYEVYNALYKVALAQTISETNIIVEVNRASLAYFMEDTNKEVEVIISSWMNWAAQTGAPLWESEFDEILIDNDKSSTDNAIKPRLENVQENSHWSEAERKIYEGIKSNEKLLKELLEKLNKQEKE
jgi:transcriptional regulator with XRE-family HTH domain